MTSGTKTPGTPSAPTPAVEPAAPTPAGETVEPVAEHPLVPEQETDEFVGG